MRFLVMLILLLWAAGTGVGYADDLEKALEEAGKPGSTSNDYFKKKKAEREKALLPIKEELQRCLKDEKADPSLALLFSRFAGATPAELGLSNDQLETLDLRGKQMGAQAYEALLALGETRLRGYVIIRYNLFPFPKDAQRDLDRGYGHFEGWSAERSESAFYHAAHGLGEHQLELGNRAMALEETKQALARTAEYTPETDAPAFCHTLWQTKLMKAFYYTKRWEFTPEEIGIAPKELQQREKQAKGVAAQVAKKLMKELRMAQTLSPGYVKFLKYHWLPFLFTVVSPAEAGTTAKAVAALVERR